MGDASADGADGADEQAGDDAGAANAAKNAAITRLRTMVASLKEGASFCKRLGACLPQVTLLLASPHAPVVHDAIVFLTFCKCVALAQQVSCSTHACLEATSRVHEQATAAVGIGARHPARTCCVQSRCFPLLLPCNARATIAYVVPVWAAAACRDRRTFEVTGAAHALRGMWPLVFSKVEAVKDSALDSWNILHLRGKSPAEQVGVCFVAREGKGDGRVLWRSVSLREGY
jgi:hypothetical protein